MIVNSKIKAENKIYHSEIMLSCMRLAKADFQSDDDFRKRYGARNFLIYNNAVTHVLQNLKSIVGEGEFESWYSSYRNKLETDLTLRKIYLMRSETLKTGVTHFGTRGQTITIMLDSKKNTKKVSIGGEITLELCDLEEVSGKTTIECMDYAINFFENMLKDASETFLNEGDKEE